MNKILIFQKAVLNTVFFFVFITTIASCKSNEYNNVTKQERFLPSKYFVKYKINTESYTDKYYKGINTIFFPILKLKPDGSLAENYTLGKTAINELRSLSSNNNKLSLISNIAKNFNKNLDFHKSSYICELPENFEREKSYFIKFYFLNKDSDLDFNYLYVKVSIDLFDISNEVQPSKVVWIGEGNFGFDKNIDMETVLESSIDILMKFSFLNKEINGNMYLLNN